MGAAQSPKNYEFSSDVLFLAFIRIINNYSSSPNGLSVNSGLMGYWLRGHEGKRNNCLSKIQLVGKKNIETKQL